MPQNKPTIREAIIDRCLISSRDYGIDEMMEEVNIVYRRLGFKELTSRSTIHYDMKSIEERHKVIIKPYYISRHCYYRYEDPEFSIYKKSLSEQELVHLHMTIGILSEFEGLPEFDWITDTIARCQDMMRMTPDYSKSISLEHNPFAHGLENLTPLCSAIVNKHTLDIWYHSFNYPEPQKNTIHPYYLKQYNQRWFLFCYNDYRKEISTYPLDRIEKIEYNRDIDFIENTFRDFGEYFEDLIGVSEDKDSELQKIKIWVDAKQWPYIETKPLHGSQKVIDKNTNGGVIFQIEVKPNYELEQKILAQGDRFEVLEPQSIRDRIALRLENALAKYRKE